MNLIERAKNILVAPKTEWPKIASEETSLASVFTSYVLPFLILGAAATTIGWGLIGKTTSLGYLGSYTVKGWDMGIKYGIIALVSGSIGYFLTAFIADALAPSFGSEKNINRSGQLAGYASTPGLIAGILAILPVIGWLIWIVSLYGIYLMYLGLGPVKKTPEDKKVVYLIVIYLIYIVATVVLSMILVSILITTASPTRLSL